MLEWVKVSQNRDRNQKSKNIPTRTRLKEEDSEERPILAIVPGLTGNITKLYMVSIIKCALQANYDVCVINYRG